MKKISSHILFFVDGTAHDVTHIIFDVKVGMRRFHYKRNPDYCPSINIDRLWSLVPSEVYQKAADGSSDQAPVIDVTKLVSSADNLRREYCWNKGKYMCRAILKFLAKETSLHTLSL